METVVRKTNGKGTKKDVSSIKSPALKKADEKIEAVKSEEKVETPVKEVDKKLEKVELLLPPKPEMSLEQKIEKIENLKTLIEKRELLESSRKKLGSFVIGANQFSENIVLTDENGNKFQTSNSEVVSKVVKSINETLVEKISEIEKQIEF